MANIPRLPLFVPRSPQVGDSGKLAFGSSDVLTSVKPPRFQPFEFWPESRPPRKSEEDHVPFVLGSPICLILGNPRPRQTPPAWPESRPPDKTGEYRTQFSFSSPDTITSVKRPIFFPFQFWPEPRPFRNWRERIDFDLGTPTDIINIAFLPVFQSFQFWPESRPPRNWEERINFELGSPATLVSTNPKFQQDFVLKPEIRLPVVNQPSIQGSPNPLLNDRPIGGQLSFQLEVRSPVVPHQPAEQGSPATLVYTNDKPFQQFTLKPEVNLPIVPHQPSVQGSAISITSTAPPPAPVQYQPFQFWPEIRLPVVPHQPTVQGTPSDLVYTNEKPFQQFTLLPEIKLPVVPHQPTIFGSSQSLLDSPPPGSLPVYQSFQFWPEIRLPVIPHQPSIQGTPGNLTHTNEKPSQQAVLPFDTKLSVVESFINTSSPDSLLYNVPVGEQLTPIVDVRARDKELTLLGSTSLITSSGVVTGTPFVPFQNWPDVRRRDDEYQQTDLGSPASLIITVSTSKPTPQPITWPDIKLPTVQQPNVQGTPNYLIRDNPKPFQTFTLRPEIRFPVVDQPSVLGTSYALFYAPPFIPPIEPPPPEAPPVAGGVSGPFEPFVRPLITNVTIEGIILRCYAILLPGNVEIISFLPGMPQTGVVINQLSPMRPARFKFMDTGRVICNEVTDDEMEEFLKTLLRDLGA